jgi:hypothetical protein
MFAPDAPELRIVTQKIRELSTLICQGRTREACDLRFEVGDSEHFTEDEAGIVETERLVEVAGYKKLARCLKRNQRCGRFHYASSSAWLAPIRHCLT